MKLIEVRHLPSRSRGRGERGAFDDHIERARLHRLESLEKMPACQVRHNRSEMSSLMDVAHTTVRHINAGHTWKDVDAAWHVS